MIIFDLACQHDHQFEGWFQSREDFDSQLGNGLIACPHCASIKIRRVPSAVHLTLPKKPTAVPVKQASTPDLPIDMHAGALTAFRQLSEMLLAHCEDVGIDFANEARRIHYVEAPARSIRGEASAEEVEALLEEGIEVFRLARLKPGDFH